MAEFEAAYNEYWARRKLLQQQDRDTLDARLQPQAERLAKAIRAEQRAGHNITELQDRVQNRNRNFLYSIVSMLPKNSVFQPNNVVSIATQQTLPAAERTEDELGWSYELDRAEREVWIFTSDRADLGYDPKVFKYELDEFNQIVTIPEEWYSDPKMSEAERSFYREIIADINKNAVQAPPQTLE